MKCRPLRKRGVIRFFRDNTRETLWRWSSGKMEAHHNYEGEHWRKSIRNPLSAFPNGWREITLAQAKRSFSVCFEKKVEVED